MTDHEADLELMKSIRQYQRTNEKIACVRNRIREHVKTLRRVVEAFENVRGDSMAPHKRCADTDWNAISKDAADLSDLMDEKHEIEAILRQAGFDQLIRPDWEPPTV